MLSSCAIVCLILGRVMGYVMVDPRCSLSNDLFTKESAQVAYNQARSEIGLGPKEIPPPWHFVFNHESTKCVLVKTPSTCLTYRAIIKCGNDAIRASLVNGTTACEQCSAHVIDCAKIGDQAGKLCADRDIITFTFVREPLSHFLSGYSEFMYRHYAKSNRAMLRGEKYSALRAGVKERDEPLAFLLEQIKGENWIFDDGVVRKHMSLMSGFLPHIPAGGSRMMEFVGELSTSDSDWEKLFALAKIYETPLGNQALARSLGTHGSSLDPLGVRAELSEILATNSSLRRGLCRLLERDYVCFQYDFNACLNGSSLERAS